MRSLRFSEKTVFKVLDRKKLKNHIDRSRTPAGFYESWGKSGIPCYIIVRRCNKYEENSNILEDEEDIEGSACEFRSYDTYDVHENYDIATLQDWEEYRLEYLLEEEIIEKVGYYSKIDQIEKILDKNAGKINIKNHDELEKVEENLQK